MQPSRDISRLIEIMAALRRPGTGCGWDIAQTFETIVPYPIEEAYEIADAVARGNMGDFKEELGDLLLQVVFQARIAGARAFRFRRRGRDDRAKNDPASSACVCRDG
jgi:nucleoside triphosphate diphosphatase